MLCPNCDKQIKPEPVNALRVFKIGEHSVEIHDKIHRCPKCYAEWSQPNFNFAYEVYKVFRAKYCQTCEQQCPVKYVGNLQGCLGYQQTCLCKICVDRQCGARGLDHVQTACPTYQPDPNIQEFWYRDRKIINKIRVTNKYFGGNKLDDA